MSMKENSLPFPITRCATTRTVSEFEYSLAFPCHYFKGKHDNYPENAKFSFQNVAYNKASFWEYLTGQFMKFYLLNSQLNDVTTAV